MSVGTNVVYDKMTRRVVIYEKDGHWVIPGHMDLAHYASGVEPVLIESYDGSVYLKPNSVIVKKL